MVRGIERLRGACSPGCEATDVHPVAISRVEAITSAAGRVHAAITRRKCTAPQMIVRTSKPMRRVSESAFKYCLSTLLGDSTTKDWAVDLTQAEGAKRRKKLEFAALQCNDCCCSDYPARER